LGFLIRDARGAPSKLAPEHLQQATFSEWRAWQAATGDTRTCLSCHPAHTFGGPHREARLRQSVRVAFAPSTRTFTVSTTGVGHAFPSGDVMRWLSIEIADDPLFEEREVVARFGKTLQMRGDHLQVVSDTTIVGSARVTVTQPFRYYRLLYHLVSEPEEQGLDSALTAIVLDADAM
jgi:hypothetical protein